MWRRGLRRSTARGYAGLASARSAWRFTTRLVIPSAAFVISLTPKRTASFYRMPWPTIMSRLMPWRVLRERLGSKATRPWPCTSSRGGLARQWPFANLACRKQPFARQRRWQQPIHTPTPGPWKPGRSKPCCGAPGQAKRLIHNQQEGGRMKEFEEYTITEGVIARVRQAADPRMRTISEALVRHLHAFLREVRPTEAEWAACIQFLTATGQKCDDTRQEFILLSDTLGASTLVDAINNPVSGDKPAPTVCGPFYMPPPTF